MFLGISSLSIHHFPTAEQECVVITSDSLQIQTPCLSVRPRPVCNPSLPHCPVSPSPPRCQAEVPLLCGVHKSGAHRVADCVKAAQTMFLLNVCSSSHSCCSGLAGLTNAGLVLGRERARSLGFSGTCTNTDRGSRFSFTFNTDRGMNRGQESGVYEKKTHGG